MDPGFCSSRAGRDKLTYASRPVGLPILGPQQMIWSVCLICSYGAAGMCPIDESVSQGNGHKLLAQRTCLPLFQMTAPMKQEGGRMCSSLPSLGLAMCN